LGWPVLHHASRASHIEVVCYLLDQGADINIVDIFDWTIVYQECLNGHLEMVELLVSRGADLTITTHKGGTPLMIASVT